MSQAELHFMSLRLQGGKLNKAKKGELRFPLPVGFCYDPDGRTVVDPDQQVECAVRLLFASFCQTGSACGVVHHFAQKGIQFPNAPMAESGTAASSGAAYPGAEFERF